MSRLVALVVVGLVGCGPAVSTGGTGGSTGGDVASTSAASTSAGATSSDAAGDPDGSSGSAAGSSSGIGTTTGEPTHCQVEVLESTQLSPERFGTLTIPSGHPEFVLLGGLGWTVSGSVDAPVVERFLEPLGEMLAGRFGPGGGWAFAHLTGDVVDVLPLDDPDVGLETIVANNAPILVGDMDDDGLDDLIASEGGTVRVWRANGAGGFSLLAESEESYPNAFRGYAPATDWAPAAVLVAQAPTESGVLGLEVTDDVLEKVYTADVVLVWSMQGVEPTRRAGRSILTVSSGGTLLDPLDGYVAFTEGQDGTWTSRGIELVYEVSTEPRAVDLDADGVLDAVFTIAREDARLIGACSQGDELVPCLELPLTANPESIAVDPAGQVFVATEAAGLWVYRLGACR